MSAIAAIVLAAGRGSRFGGASKLLENLDVEPLVGHAVRAALQSSARPVLVVLGHEAGRVAQALASCAVRTILNPDHADGLSTSLKAGFAALPPEADAAIVLLGDMPRVKAATIDRLAAAWGARRSLAVVPTFKGRRGNPVLLSRALEPDLSALSGDTGAGPLLKGRPGVVECPVDDPAVLQDVDTPEALAALRR